MPITRFVAVALAVAVSSGCVLTTKGTLYVEPSSRGGAAPQVRRVAVVPNRLPTMLTDPEYWRRSNFRLVEADLRRNGMDVVDYDTSVRAFEESGLPVEDTRSSRDKYAELASQLGVDAIVIPYYGTFAATKSAAMVVTNSYTSVATFQLYSAHKNDFVMRIDANGQWTHTTGVLSAIGVITAIVGPAVSLGTLGGCTGCGIAGGIVGIVGAALPLVDLLLTLVIPPFSLPAEAHWERAFGAGIKAGLKPMYTALGLAAGAPPPRVMPAPPPPPRAAPAPAYAPPPAPSGGGCTTDAQCKTGRTCIQGQCTWKP